MIYHFKNLANRLTNIKGLNINEDRKIKYFTPNFAFEWQEAKRYPELKSLRKEKWIELAKKGSKVKYSKIKDVLGNLDLAFDNLNQNKKSRFNKAFIKGNIETPIVLKFSDRDYDLMAGNTRASGLIKNNIDVKFWVVDVSDLE